MIPISYNVRSLTARKSSTLAAAIGVALVVFIFAAVLMLSEGIGRTLKSAGLEQNAIVIRKGSQSEMQSGIEDEKVSVLRSAQEVAQGTDGQPMVSGEVVVIITVPRNTGDGMANVSVRGLTEKGLALRDNVRIIQGRPAKPGTDEVVVGRALLGRLKGLELDQSMELKRNRAVRIVGVMAAGGSSIESEIWGDLDMVRSVFNREASVSSILVRLKEKNGLAAIATRMDADPRLGLEIKRETAYYEEQSQGLSVFISALGLVIAVFFSIGAMIGAMITMYAQIAARTREIGTLRALGFRRGRVLVSFLLESIILSVAGGLVGCLGALGMGFVKFTTINFQTFTEIVFSFTPTPAIMASSLVFATAMGIFGGLFPAVRASRVSPVQAMRG
jgi:putative ABC transport system permease protein